MKNRRLGVETERSGVPHRESKPSAHRHRTARIARMTRQINGAMDFWRLGRTEADFPPHRVVHEITSRVLGVLSFILR